MRYSREEALQEIMRRGEHLTQKRRRRSIRLLSGASLVLAFLLVTAVWQTVGMSATSVKSAAYGSYLLSEEAGGYVLTGVIMFVLGIVVAMLCHRHRRKKLQEQITCKTEKTEGNL